MFGLFKKNSNVEEAKSDTEHAIIIRSAFESGDEYGTEDERHSLQELDESLESRLEQEGFEWDGHEVGDGEFIIYCYGSNADKMLPLIEERLRLSPFIWFDITLRYGSAEDKDAKEKQMRINTKK